MILLYIALTGIWLHLIVAMASSQISERGLKMAKSTTGWVTIIIFILGYLLKTYTGIN